MEFISEGIFEKYSKMKILFVKIFEKGQILRPFSGLAPSKLKIFSKKFNGSICAYRIFYLPIFGRIEGGGGLIKGIARQQWKEVETECNFVRLTASTGVLF